MADNEKDNIEEMDEDLVVVMTDEEGNEYYYREELIIPIGEKRFAILVSIDDADCGCGCEAGAEEDVFIARIDTDENGEEVYLDPTDEEFEQVREAYEELMEDEEDEAE
ncbi:DUF1292 domain-containing protein [Dendrosporobacter sp. 1207_IL3150]|uniref:DUF1292 domain-containing protein n=1 Tax=Dendrosporobacter sp. 1207_IL3150 TaxID=3084054 RepID=UPI002FDB328B